MHSGEAKPRRNQQRKPVGKPEAFRTSGGKAAKSSRFALNADKDVRAPLAGCLRSYSEPVIARYSSSGKALSVSVLTLPCFARLRIAFA